MKNDRALFSIWHTVPGHLDYPTDRYHMTFSDVWSYVNFLEKYGFDIGDKENYFLDSVQYKFKPNSAGDMGEVDLYQNQSIFLVLKKKENH